MKHFKLGQFVKINSDNENYEQYRGKHLKIVHVAKNKDEHPGYDESVYPQQLYDLETMDGSLVPFSLYDYELIRF